MTTPHPLKRTNLGKREDLIEDSYFSVAAAAAVSRVLAAGSSRELEAWSAGEGAVAPRCHRPQELQAGNQRTIVPE